MQTKTLKNKIIKSTKNLSIEELIENLNETKTELELVKRERDYLRKVLVEIKEYVEEL